MDLKFITINIPDIILIGGAMTDLQPESPVTKLNGIPLKLSSNYNTNNIETLKKSEEITVQEKYKEIFKKDQKRLKSVLQELKENIENNEGNLTQTYIKSILYKNNKEPLIITWNGRKIREILHRLNIKCNNSLDISCYEKKEDGKFYLTIFNKPDDKVIAQVYIGQYEKNGKFLSMEETHRIICNENHIHTYRHDSISNVSITKCIYEYVISKIPNPNNNNKTIIN